MEAARQKQIQRFQGLNLTSNAEMTPKEIKKFCRLDDQILDFLRQAVSQMHLSARSYHRLLKVSRTIADLAGAPEIEMHHLSEALQYRSKE